VAFVVMALIGSLSCREATEWLFAPLAGVTRLVVRRDQDTLGVIENADSVAAVVRFVNERQKGWDRRGLEYRLVR
jgi:hypothetical protein